MKRLIVWVGVLVVLGTAAYAGFGWYSARNATGMSYRTTQVRRTDLASTISATGTLVPEDVVDVGTQVNGQIASFGIGKDGKAIDYRSMVDEDMVLARIDDTLYAADVGSAQAQLNQAKSQVNLSLAVRDQVRARLEQTRRDWERAQRLANTAALSRADYDAAQSAYDQAQASVAVAEAQILQAEAQVSQAEASLQRATRNLAYCTIKSPVNGVIIDKRVEIGQTVVSSLNAPSLFLLAKDLSRMQVLVQVNEADIGHVTPGQQVRFGVDAFAGQKFKGEVRKVRLNASMTQNVVTYTVEIATDNSDQKLLPYLTANVRFDVARKQGVLAVPNAALRWSPRGAGGDVGGAGGAGGAGSAGGARGAGGAGGAGGATGAAAPGAQGSQGQTGQQSRRADNGGAESAEGDGGRTGTVWVVREGQARPMSVNTGLTDGVMTEIEGEGVVEGLEVIVGEQSADQAAKAGAGAGTNPFAPQPFRGRGR